MIGNNGLPRKGHHFPAPVAFTHGHQYLGKVLTEIKSEMPGPGPHFHKNIPPHPLPHFFLKY